MLDFKIIDGCFNSFIDSFKQIIGYFEPKMNNCFQELVDFGKSNLINLAKFVFIYHRLT